MKRAFNSRLGADRDLGRIRQGRELYHRWLELLEEGRVQIIKALGVN